jgi:hypothetical protein
MAGSCSIPPGPARVGSAAQSTWIAGWNIEFSKKDITLMNKSLKTGEQIE